MLQVTNLTPYAVDRTIAVDADGVQVWVVVIKATFRLLDDGTVALAEAADQEVVCAAPEYFAEPGRSSLRRETELVFEHPGTDIIVNASAHAPGGRPTSAVLVEVAAGRLRKALRVLGARSWRRCAGKIAPSSPEPFVSMPIRYERAFGGSAPRDLPTRVDFRNPVGCGLHDRPEEILDTPAPNVEDPQHPVVSANASSLPAGYGIIGPSWLPRRALAGTFDEEWRRTRMPFLPKDFDPRFYACASPGLHSPEHLRGGERVELINLSVSGQISFKLPTLRFIVHTLIERQRLSSPVVLDRVMIEPDIRRLFMVWRTSLRCGARARRVEKSIVSEKPRRAK